MYLGFYDKCVFIFACYSISANFRRHLKKLTTTVPYDPDISITSPPPFKVTEYLIDITAVNSCIACHATPVWTSIKDNMLGYGIL